MKCWTVWLAIASGLWCPSARADILIESRRAPSSPDDAVVLAPLRDVLAARGVATRGADIAVHAAEALPFRALAEPAPHEDAAALSALVDAGTRQVFHGDYASGIATLEGALAIVRSSPVIIASDGSAPRWLTKAYASLAFAQLRTKKLDLAREAVAEQIRSFPEDPIGRLVGPEVAQLAEETRKAVDDGPHGTLEIAASRADVRVFVNERPRGSGRWTASVPVGRYRVLLVVAGVARRYLVEVQAGGRAAIEIDWQADAAFAISSERAGFVWRAGAEDRTDRAAAAYARRSSSDDVLVAAIVVRDGARFLEGKAFQRRTGTMLRHEAVALDGSTTCVRALAQYLVDGAPIRCRVEPAFASGSPARREPATSDRFAGAGVLAGVGAIATLGGLTLMATNTDEPHSGTSLASVPGAALTVVGAVAIGAAAFWARGAVGEGGQPASRSLGPSYAAAGGAVAAFVVGGYLLHLDGATTCGDAAPSTCAYRYRTAGEGWALLGTGAVAAGFSIYWAVRTRRASGPAVSVAPTTRTGALVSLEGSF